MITVNLWGAPSSGKSTTAAGLFFLMKINKRRVELVTEFAKDLVWERRESIFGEQSYIFGEQNHRLQRLDGQVDFAITDSPLPLVIFYMNKGYMKTFPGMVFEQFDRYENINYLLRRMGDFETDGRRHTETQSIAIANDMENFLKENNIQYTVLDANPQTPQVIFDDLMRRLPGPVEMTLRPAT